MTSYFDYTTIAQSEKFISRAKEAKHLAENIKNKKFTVIYSAPGYGKKSLVDRAFQLLKRESFQTEVFTIDLFNVTTAEQLTEIYCNLFRPLVEEVNRTAIMPLNVNFSNPTPSLALNLPNAVASLSGRNIVIYFKEFQNLLNFEKGEVFLKMMEKELSHHSGVTYIVTGEQHNRMRYIFEDLRLFYTFSEVMEVAPLDKKETVQYLQNGFMYTGKVIEEDTAAALWKVTRGFPWFVNRIAATCDTLSIGYINKKILDGAIEDFLAKKESRYRFMMSQLTANQVNFVRAVCDGVERFSSAEILKKYKLNSSANVFRVKEAVYKKEVVTFDKDDRASFIDPLFEHWLHTHYFV